jgi:hypothetical protein
MWDIVFDRTTECLEARGVSSAPWVRGGSESAITMSGRNEQKERRGIT